MNKIIDKSISARLILVPKGDDSTPCLTAFEEATGITVPEFKARQLEVSDGKRTFIKVKGRDIPGLIAAGYGDIGLAGSDSCEEYMKSSEAGITYQTYGASMCRFVLLAPRKKAAALRKQLKAKASSATVATSFPNLLKKIARQQNLPFDVTNLSLSGSVEIMPSLMGVDLVADLVSTGATAKTNGLVEIKTLLEVYPAVVTRGN